MKLFLAYIRAASALVFVAVTLSTASAMETKMKYMILIYGSEAAAADGPAPGTPEFEAYLAEYQALTTDIAAAGKLIASEALQPTGTATSLRIRNGATETMDGPFADTKEQLGGFYLVECENLDEALAFAARIPDARTGTVEVRPIMAFE